MAFGFAAYASYAPGLWRRMSGVLSGAGAAGVSLLLLSGCAGGSGAVAPASIKAPAPPPAFAQADFMNRAVEDVDALLGAPALVRKEGEGEFRRYDLAACALIVLLYPDEAGVKRVRALHAGAKTATASAPDLDECLARGAAPAVSAVSARLG